MSKPTQLDTTWCSVASAFFLLKPVVLKDRYMLQSAIGWIVIGLSCWAGLAFAVGMFVGKAIRAGQPQVATYVTHRPPLPEPRTLGRLWPLDDVPSRLSGSTSGLKGPTGRPPTITIRL
jgi:hypothetical protein